MKLFWKHIWRSIRRAPLQPLLICLAATLCVALCVTVSGMAQLFVRHSAEQALLETELGDVLVTPRTDSDSHLLFAEDVAHVLGDKAQVLGEFRISGFAPHGTDTHVLGISALDLKKADEFYEFSFLSYDSFTTQNLNSAAILSKDAARRLGVGIGESFTVRIWESECTYTVRAIAEPTGLLSQTDMLVSITGLLQTLSHRLPVLGSLGEDFSPCTRLLIRAGEGTDAAEVQALLREAQALAGASVSLAAREGQQDFLVTIQLVFVFLLLLLLLVLACFVICTSLSLLHTRRSAEYAVFAAAGADARMIGGIIYLESALYALLCGVGGVLLSLPMLALTGSFYSWNETVLRPGISGTLVGFASSFLLMGLCTAWHLHRIRGTHARKSAPLWERLLPAALLLPLLLLCFLLPIGYRVFACAFCVLLAVWALFSYVPLLLQAAMRGIEPLLERSAAWLLLALKNVRHQFMLRHVARLFAVLLALILSILVCAGAVTDQVKIMTEELPFDFVILGVSEERGEEILQDPAVESAMYMIYVMGIEMPNGANAFASSFEGDTDACLPRGYRAERMPKGDEILLSEGLMERIGCEVGDRMPLVIGGVSHEFVVAGSIQLNTNCFYFDADAIGMERNMLCVRLQDAARESVADTERLTALLESKGGVMAPSKAAFGVLPETLGGHLKLASFSIYAALALGLLGCANALLQQYDARRREREILRECGMGRGALGAMCLAELLIVFLFAALCAAPAAVLICRLVDFGVRSFGVVLFF